MLITKWQLEIIKLTCFVILYFFVCRTYESIYDLLCILLKLRYLNDNKLCFLIKHHSQYGWQRKNFVQIHCTYFLIYSLPWQCYLGKEITAWWTLFENNNEIYLTGKAISDKIDISHFGLKYMWIILLLVSFNYGHGFNNFLKCHQNN
jgi:hypothetical protein